MVAGAGMDCDQRDGPRAEWKGVRTDVRVTPPLVVRQAPLAAILAA